MGRLNKIAKWLALFALVFCIFCTKVNAKGGDTSFSVARLNEYDVLSNCATQSDRELKAKGYSTKEISMIRDLKKEYINHLSQYTTLNSDALKELGYTQEQISILRNFKGTEAEIRALAATLDFYLSADFVRWDAGENRTNARLSYNFNWNGVPLIGLTDIVGVTWNDWTIRGSSSYVTYVHLYGSEQNYYLPATFVDNNGPASYGGGYKFVMKQKDNYFWAKSGYGIFSLYHNYTRHDLSAYAEYGHSTVSVYPSFSIPGYGSINFSDGVNRQAQDWANMTCQN